MKRRTGLVALSLVILPGALVSQRPACPRVAGDTAAFTLSDVERRPVADSANSPPGYPPLLRQAGVQGPVRVAFTVDTAGHVEPATIRIVRSPNPGFDLFVKRAVTTWRYAPASRCGRPVRVRLEHELAFRVSSTPRDTLRLAELFEIDTSVTAVADTLTDGTPRTTVGWRATAVVMEPVPWESMALDSAEEAAVDRLVGGIPQTSSGVTRVVCVPGVGGPTADPDLRRLIRLTRPGIAVLPERRCPPSFVSMIATPGQRPEPPGEDPFHVQILSRSPISATRVAFSADVWHGNSGVRHRCGVERHPDGWRVNCYVASYWVS